MRRSGDFFVQWSRALAMKTQVMQIISFCRTGFILRSGHGRFLCKLIYFSKENNFEEKGLENRLIDWPKRRIHVLIVTPAFRILTGFRLQLYLPLGFIYVNSKKYLEENRLQIKSRRKGNYHQACLSYSHLRLTLLFG